MTGSSELIVLGHTKFGDNSIVLHTLGRVYGRRSFLVRIGKRAGMAMFLPLSIVEADITENPKSTLWSARNFSSRYGLAGIRGNIYKNAMSMFMAEVLFRTLKEGSCEEGLYDWCCGQILTLDALESDFSNFHLLFLLGLASALGFRPRFEDLIPFVGGGAGAQGASEDLIVGSGAGAQGASASASSSPAVAPLLGDIPSTAPAVSTARSHTSLANSSRLIQIRQLVTLPFGEAMLLPLTGQARSGICEDILRYLSFHSETPINIRSLPVLRELFM